MGMNVDQVYLDLSKLLNDICKFLDKDKLSSLLPHERAIADSLINRSKVQLQEISKITDYVHMDRRNDIIKKKVDTEENYKNYPNQDVEENEEEGQTYNTIEHVGMPPKNPSEDFKFKPQGTMNNYVERDNFGKRPSESSSYSPKEKIVPPPAVCPYSDLPAKDTMYCVKYGYISWKVKVIFGIAKMKRIYAAVYECWLLIYNTDKDMKPATILDLRHHEVKEQDTKYFELSSKKEEMKYFFMALTEKDMKQWVSHISRVHERRVQQEKPMEPLTPQRIEPELSEEEDSENENYQEIDSSFILSNTKPPDLPKRPNIKPSPVAQNNLVVEIKPSLNQLDDEEMEEETYYQIENPIPSGPAFTEDKSEGDRDSFSDDEDDENSIYVQVTNINPSQAKPDPDDDYPTLYYQAGGPLKGQNGDDDGDDIYDTVSAPSEPVKRPPPTLSSASKPPITHQKNEPPPKAPKPVFTRLASRKGFLYST